MFKCNGCTVKGDHCITVCFSYVQGKSIHIQGRYPGSIILEIFIAHFWGRYFYKKEFTLSESKFFPLIEASIQKGVIMLENQTPISKKLIFFCKMPAKVYSSIHSPEAWFDFIAFSKVPIKLQWCHLYFGCSVYVGLSIAYNCCYISGMI